MKISFVNNWQYMFSKDSIGGRFSMFTVITISAINMGIKEIDGFHFTILGLGFRITKDES